MFKIKRTQTISLNRNDVFPFFAKPENLAKITPSWLNFTITSDKLEMVKGAKFNYKIKVLGIPLRWKSEITEYNPPSNFTDEQIKGPYKKWIHNHYFNEMGNKTEVIDEVTYDLYGGIFKHLINKIFVQKKLKEIFDHRSEYINKQLTK